MKKLQALVAVAGLLVAGSAFAQGAPDKGKAAPPPAAAPAKPPEAPMVPKAAAEMDQMKGMIGTWKCDGKMTGAGMDMPIKSTYKVAWDMDNMWLVGHLEGAKSKMMPRAYKAVDYYTYDPGKKEYVKLSVDNMGGGGRATYKGWEGDKQGWDGKTMMMGGEMDDKTVITRKGDKEVELEIKSSGGGHDMAETITCKR